MQETTDIALQNIEVKAGTDELFIVDTLPANDNVNKILLSNIDSSDNLETISTSAKLSGDGTGGSPIVLATNSLTTSNIADNAITGALLEANVILQEHIDVNNTITTGEFLYNNSGTLESVPIPFLSTVGAGSNIFDNTTATVVNFNTLTASGSASVSLDGSDILIDLANANIASKSISNLGTGTSFNPVVTTNDVIEIETSGNATINNPASYTGTDGKTVVFKVKQGTGAPHTISWGTDYDFQNKTITDSTVAGKFDLYVFNIDESNNKLRLITRNSGLDKMMFTPTDIASSVRAWVLAEGSYNDLKNNVAAVEGGVLTNPPISNGSKIPTAKAFTTTFGNDHGLRFTNASDINGIDDEWDVYALATIPITGNNCVALQVASNDSATVAFGASMYTQVGSIGVSIDWVKRTAINYQTATITEDSNGIYLISASQTANQMFDYGTAFTNTLASGTTNSSASHWAIGNVLSGDGTSVVDITSTGVQIYEVIVTNPLTTANRQRLEGYIAHRTSTQSDLDASHPYKTVYPYKDLSN